MTIPLKNPSTGQIKGGCHRQVKQPRAARACKHRVHDAEQDDNRRQPCAGPTDKLGHSGTLGPWPARPQSYESAKL